MPGETFAAARARLVEQLGALGWTTRPGLKIPWAEPPGGGYRLWFRPQAVYLNEHSLHIDNIRGMPVQTLLAHVQRAAGIRFGSHARRRTSTMTTTERFKITARETRGGYRGVAIMHNGVIAIKTVPVFREKKDAMDAMRGWLKEHGAHADWHRGVPHGSRRIPHRERKFIPRKFFALPERAPGKGALPLADPRRPDRYDAKHVRNAAARLAMMRNSGSVTAEEYRRAERAIIRGACATGVERTCKRHLAKVIPISRAHEIRETRMAAYSRPRRSSRTGRFTR